MGPVDDDLAARGKRNANHLFDLVRVELGKKARTLYLDSGKHGVDGLLYDSVGFTIAYEQPRGNLAAGILVEGFSLVTLFGQRLTLDSDDESVRATLRQMDEWARLHIPDKYLERFDQAYGTSGSPSVTPSNGPDAAYFAQLRYRSGQRVPVQLFKVDADGPHVYDRATQAFIADTAGSLAGLQRDPLREQLWPITPKQAAETEQMLRTDQYHPLTIPGVYD